MMLTALYGMSSRSHSFCKVPDHRNLFCLYDNPAKLHLHSAQGPVAILLCSWDLNPRQSDLEAPVFSHRTR